MAAGLAHEIRNPLAGIKGAAQFLQTVDDSEPGSEFLQVIISEVDRLNEVVQNFLYYARPFELNAEPTDVNATLSHVLSLVRAEGLPEGIRIEEHFGGVVGLCGHFYHPHVGVGSAGIFFPAGRSGPPIFTRMIEMEVKKCHNRSESVTIRTEMCQIG